MKRHSINNDGIDIEKLRYERLRGQYKHYCNDWDMMAIDEHSPEYACCTCNKTAIKHYNEQKRKGK